MRVFTRRAFLASVLLFVIASVSSALTPAQQTTLAADLASNTALVNGVQIKDTVKSADNAVAVANHYNQPTSPAYLAWRSDASVPDILDQVTWTNYTPADNPPASGSTVQISNDMMLYQNRAMLIAIKQTNLTLMLTGRATFNAAKPTLRGGLNDATLNLPSGAAGALRSGGWANILPVLRRTTLRGERLYTTAATGVGNDGIPGNRGTATNPDLMGFEGQITDADIRASWGI